MTTYLWKVTVEIEADSESEAVYLAEQYQNAMEAAGASVEEALLDTQEGWSNGESED